MLTELRLKNFQKHHDIRVAFNPGITVLVGPSDAGKSAIIRAIRWLAEHRPITGFQTHGTEDTRVGIKTDEGMVIRFKDKKEYGYAINGKKFLATGSVQPVGVKQVLGFEPINFQSQHDPIFLLSLTPGQMARELNRIVALDAIDKAITDINSRISKKNTETGVHESAIQGWEEQLEQISWVDSAKEKLDEIDAKADSLDTTVQKIERLKSIIRETDARRQKIRIYKAALTALKALAEKNKKLEIAQAKAATLRKCQQQLAKQIPFEDAVSRIATIRKKAEQLRDLMLRKVHLDTIVETIREGALSLLSLDREINELKHEIGGIPKCPTCGKML